MDPASAGSIVGEMHFIIRVGSSRVGQPDPMPDPIDVAVAAQLAETENIGPGKDK